jgi:hypothetical protein
MILIWAEKKKGDVVERNAAFPMVGLFKDARDLWRKRS